jgi:hypothetical protein
MKEISLHLLDIIQNSIAAGAGKITVALTVDSSSDKLVTAVIDNGTGMDEDFLERVINPFVTTRTTRKVGMGIPLFKASAEQAGGELKINSAKGIGTELEASFKISHIDRLPLGDISGTIRNLIASEPDIQYILILSNLKDEFLFDSLEIKEKLGEVPINEFAVLEWIHDYIDGGIKAIFGGVLDEIDS